MAATTGINRQATQLTCFMPCTSAMKITARPSASSMEQFTEQPMAAKTGPRKRVRQQAFSEFILLMPIMALSLATTVCLLERQTAAKTGSRKQAEQSISFEQFPSLTRTLGLLLVVILIWESALFSGQQMEGKL